MFYSCNNQFSQSTRFCFNITAIFIQALYLAIAKLIISSRYRCVSLTVIEINTLYSFTTQTRRLPTQSFSLFFPPPFYLRIISEPVPCGFFAVCFLHWLDIVFPIAPEHQGVTAPSLTEVSWPPYQEAGRGEDELLMAQLQDLIRELPGEVAGNIHRREFDKFWREELKPDIWTARVRQEGYKLSFKDGCRLKSYEGKNNKSALDDMEFTWQQLKDWQRKGCPAVCSQATLRITSLSSCQNHGRRDQEKIVPGPQ